MARATTAGPPPAVELSLITSANNPKLRYVRNLRRKSFRGREGRLALEGVRLVADALAAGIRPAFALAGPALDQSPGGPALRASLVALAVPVLDVVPALFDTVCETATPQGIVAVVDGSLQPWPEQPGLVVIADGLRDPGNLGTLWRGALAAGADGLLLAPGTVEATSPKVVRATMGAWFRLPALRATWAEVDRHTTGLALWVADAAAPLDYTAVDWCQPSALVIGGETAGPSADARARASGVVRIPMAGPAESLNAAMAATVILFEAARQRGAAAG